MAKIVVHAGDFRKGDGQMTLGTLSLKTDEHKFLGESIPLVNLKSVELATEENIKKLGGTIG